MNAIVAVSEEWGIGKDNDLLFSIPDDMKFFRTTTSGKTIIMGRKTLESLPGGKPLKNRRNIVITTHKDLNTEGIEIVSSPLEAAELVKNELPENVFVIGGGEVYRAMLPFCTKAYITKVRAKPQADKYFPDVDTLLDWRLTEQSEERLYEGLSYTFCVYEKDAQGCQISKQKIQK